MTSYPHAIGRKKEGVCLLRCPFGGIPSIEMTVCFESRLFLQRETIEKKNTDTIFKNVPAVIVEAGGVIVAK